MPLIPDAHCSEHILTVSPVCLVLSGVAGVTYVSEITVQRTSVLAPRIAILETLYWPKARGTASMEHIKDALELYHSSRVALAATHPPQ